MDPHCIKLESNKRYKAGNCEQSNNRTNMNNSTFRYHLEKFQNATKNAKTEHKVEDEEDIVWTRGYAEQKAYIKDTIGMFLYEIKNPDSFGKDPEMQRLRSMISLFEFMALDENSDAIMDSEFTKMRAASLKKAKDMEKEMNHVIKTRLHAVCHMYESGTMNEDKFMETCTYYMNHRDNALYAFNTFYDLFKNRI